MNTNRGPFGMISEAIKALCSMLISLFTMAEEGVQIADASVRVAREKQAIDLTGSLEEYRTQSLMRQAAESAKAREALETYVNQDPTGKRKVLVEEAHKRISTAVDAELARIRASRKQD